MNYEEEFKKLNTRRNELKQMQSKELQEKYKILMSSYIGKYFKSENGYSVEEKWFEYYEVIDVDYLGVTEYEGRISFPCICKRFSQDSGGEIRMHVEDDIMSQHIQEEISYEEFIQAQKDILSSLSNKR